MRMTNLTRVTSGRNEDEEELERRIGGNGSISIPSMETTSRKKEEDFRWMQIDLSQLPELHIIREGIHKITWVH